MPPKGVPSSERTGYGLCGKPKDFGCGGTGRGTGFGTGGCGLVVLELGEVTEVRVCQWNASECHEWGGISTWLYT